MAKDKVIKPLTEEQWNRILNTPGVVVHKRHEPREQLFFEPRVRATEKINITASELIDDDNDEWPDISCSS